MTYKEYVSAVLGRFGLAEGDVDFILTEAGLSGSTQVTTDEDKVLLKTAMYNHIPLMIAGLSNVSEGGYSVTWNIEGLKLWYSTLADELGLDDKLTAKPVVRDASNRW